MRKVKKISMHITTCDKCPHVYKTVDSKQCKEKTWRCQKMSFKVISSVEFERRPHILSSDDVFISSDKLPTIPNWCPLEDA